MKSKLKGWTNVEIQIYKTHPFWNPNIKDGPIMKSKLIGWTHCEIQTNRMDTLWNPYLCIWIDYESQNGASSAEHPLEHVTATICTSGNHYSLPFLPATPSCPSRTLEGLFELTRRPSLEIWPTPNSIWNNDIFLLFLRIIFLQWALQEWVRGVSTYHQQRCMLHRKLGVFHPL